MEDEKFVQISGKIASLARWLLQVVRRPFSISSFYNSIRLTSNSSFPIFSHLQYLIYSSIWFKPLVFTIHLIPNSRLTTTHLIPNLQLHSVNTSIFPFTFTFQFQRSFSNQCKQFISLRFQFPSSDYPVFSGVLSEWGSGRSEAAAFWNSLKRNKVGRLFRFVWIFILQDPHNHL